MKDRKQIINELNNEEKYPSFFRSVEFKYSALSIATMVVVLVLMVVILVFKEWIDSKGQVVGVIFGGGALLSFGLWFLFIRKK